MCVRQPAYLLWSADPMNADGDAGATGCTVLRYLCPRRPPSNANAHLPRPGGSSEWPGVHGSLHVSGGALQAQGQPGQRQRLGRERRHRGSASRQLLPAVRRQCRLARAIRHPVRLAAAVQPLPRGGERAGNLAVNVGRITVVGEVDYGELACFF